MKEKDDEKFFTNTKSYGNIKSKLELQFYFKKIYIQKFQKNFFLNKSFVTNFKHPF